MINTVVDIDDAVIILKLLGDKTRLTMVKLLEDHECCVCEFVDIFEMSQPAISQHLRRFKKVELVKEERRGKWIFYSLNKSNEYYPFIEGLLSRLPNQEYKLKNLEEQGGRISCC